MARFYGTVQGGRGEASRLGHETTGLRVKARSYSGDVTVKLYVYDDEDHAHIYIDHHSGDSRDCVTLYNGPIADALNKNQHSVIVQATLQAFAPELLTL